MFKSYKNRLRRYPRIRFLWRTFRHPIVGILGYIYGAYLTLRYVNTYNKFPAIIFQDGLLRLHIHKGKRAKFCIGDRLIVQPLGVTRIPCLIQMGESSEINIRGEFSIGDDVRMAVSKSGFLGIGGKNKESGSGISGGCLINAFKKILIGEDVIIAWDIFITDSDWHAIEGSSHHAATVIGSHVWVAVGAKILKGAVIGNDSIVGCSAVVLSGSYPERSLLAGVPAKIIKTSIPMWKRDLPEQANLIIAGGEQDA